MSIESSEPRRLEGEHVTGFEHHVWLNPNGVVDKIPTKTGKIWQTMTPEAAEEDHATMKEFGIPMVDTKVHGPQTVSYKRSILGITTETRTQASYLLKQPNVTPAHAMRFADLLHFQKYREVLLHLMRQRELIKKWKGVGLDLLGGQGFRLVGPALSPLTHSMEAGVGNLLVADDEIRTNGSWKKETGESVKVVAKKGDVLLCDTRLMPIGDRVRNCRDKIFAPILRLNEALQDAVLWTTLETLGANPNIVRIEDRCDTPFKRMVRQIVLNAKPKMIAQAEIY